MMVEPLIASVNVGGGTLQVKCIYFLFFRRMYVVIYIEEFIKDM